MGTEARLLRGLVCAGGRDGNGLLSEINDSNNSLLQKETIKTMIMYFISAMLMYF